MKLIRRTLSLLLSAALIAQMSFVLAFAAGGTGPIRTLATAGGTITCDATRQDIITIPANISPAVTINGYKPTDRILITGNTGTDTATIESSAGLSLKVGSTAIATIVGPVGSNLTDKQVLATVTLLGAGTSELTATIDKTKIEVLQGATAVEIATATTGNPSTVPAGLTPTYQWYKGTAPNGVADSTQKSAVLSLAPTTANAGSYYCVVSTPAGTNPVVSAMTATTPTVVLTVVPPITITTHPAATTTVVKGATGTTLSVVASGGTGPYTYQWKTSTSSTSITGAANATGTSTGSSYTVPTTAAGDFYYFCTVSSGIAAPVSTNVVKVTVTHCDATAALSITAPTSGAVINVTPTTTSYNVASTLTVTPNNCNTAAHLGTPPITPNHGYAVQYALTPQGASGTIAGATINATSGVITIAHGTLFTGSSTDVPATFTATVTGPTPTTPTTTTFNITFHKQTPTCAANPTAVTVTGITGGVDTINADSITTKTYTAAVTYDTNPSCGVVDHTAGSHGAAVTWAIVSQSGGTMTPGTDVTINPTTGVLTITKANLLKYSNDIYIKATATKGSNAPSTIFKVTITRRCPGVATVTIGNTIANFTAASNTGYTDRAIAPTVTSTNCENTTVHAATHTTFTWSVKETQNWASVTNNTTLHIDNSRIPFPSGTITLVGTPADGSAPTTKSITITRYSSGGGSSDDTSSNETQWEEVYDRVLDADSGDVLTANLGSNTEMPGYLFNKLRGKNVALKLSVDNGYTWTVNGKTITKVPSYQIYIPLDVDSYSNTRMFKLAREYDVKAFQLRHEGSFFSDMKLTIPVSADYDNKTLYLYSYNEDTNKLTYRSSAKVNGDSDVTFTFKSSVGNYLLTSKALYGENATGGGGGAITPPPATSSKPASTSSVPPSTSSSAPSTSASSVPPSTSSAPSSVPAPDSKPESQPTDVKPEKEKSKFPILVPILIVAILGVIVAVVLIARGGSGKGGMTFDD